MVLPTAWRAIVRPVGISRRARAGGRGRRGRRSPRPGGASASSGTAAPGSRPTMNAAVDSSAGIPEQLLDLRLVGAQQRGQRRRHALVAQRQAEVLRRRVDRRAADDAETAEVGVGRVGVGEVGQDDDDRRVLGEVLGEVVGVGAAPWPGRSTGRAWTSRRRSRPRSPPGRSTPRRCTPSTAPGTTRRAAALGGVSDDEEPHRLAVAALRAEAGDLDGPVEDAGGTGSGR